MIHTVDKVSIMRRKEDKYSEDVVRLSIDPVVLIKILVIQYMFELRSMRQTIREAEVNNA